MNLKIYQIDAFTDEIFGGNPAAVCPLNEWLDDTLLQKIAMENNLAETAFYVNNRDEYEIRWFTPTVEVDLCGHATLAAAYVLLTLENHEGDTVLFHSPRSGALTVARSGDLLTLNFPADVFGTVDLSAELLRCFEERPQAAYKGKTDYMLVFENEAEVKGLVPALESISQLDGRGVIVTAKGNEVDFVSRFFAPQSGIDEDPVTGSAHTTLTPYWAVELGKDELTAKQLSSRKGDLKCRILGNRVEISGKAKLYMKGEIYVD
ncbi:PhzF family phenazine biosynthesis protein [Moheibacter sediminis]|uniref:Phenazine biosynthesis protein PhzF family n=1 Tax=Moheibacter sediminis TaxID=1434700 RepID=A0A1W2AHV2_9FLAO|nr:PhzF family phenazine biosynthesis protein [Moheibacter sediminis]SMC60203.1 phenazine biosynthesis protein PhzF family [Moheibacter sediminis]